MIELSGLSWLQSPENQAYEQRVLRVIFPVAIGVSAVARAGVRLLDNGHPPPSQYAKRALIPGEEYLIQKIGSPGAGRPVSNLLERFMLDELPQLIAVKRGDGVLVGPRGTSPEHRQRLFDCLDDGRIIDDWIRILRLQRPGLLSSYALEMHARQPSVEDGALTDRQVTSEALVRYEADARDFTDASPRHSQLLVAQFKRMVRTKMKGVVSHG